MQYNMIYWLSGGGRRPSFPLGSALLREEWFVLCSLKLISTLRLNDREEYCLFEGSGAWRNSPQCLWPIMARAALTEDWATVSARDKSKLPELFREDMFVLFLRTPSFAASPAFQRSLHNAPIFRSSGSSLRNSGTSLSTSARECWPSKVTVSLLGSNPWIPHSS